LRRNYEIEILWTAFPLHPHTPEDGLTLEELFAGRNVDINEVRARLKRVAQEEGLPWGERKKTYNSRLAQELGKWAESLGKGDRFHEAAFRAYFVDGKNIGKIPILVQLAESVNLSGDEAQKVLETRSFKDAVDADWERSRTFGVMAVPTFMFDGQVIVGAQPYEVLEKLMERNNVNRRGSAH